MRRLVGDVLERAQHRRRQRIEALRHPRIAAVGGIEELHQVVGADREEIDAVEQFVELEQQRRHFQHGADLHPLGQRVAVTAQMRQLDLDQRLGLVELLHHGDHREHHAQFAPAGGAQQRAHLAAQQAGPVEAEPDGAPAERRIFLLDVAQIGQHLVAADIEGAEGHRPLAGGIEHGAVKRELLAGARQRIGAP